jgi:hypothetical protein
MQIGKFFDSQPEQPKGCISQLETWNRNEVASGTVFANTMPEVV